MRDRDVENMLGATIFGLFAGFALLWLAALFTQEQTEQTEQPERTMTAAAPAAAIQRYGVPAGTWTRQGDYLLCYDGRTRTASWALEHLTRESLARGTSRAGLSFRVDLDVPEEFRVSPQDYAKHGYDIGHVAPADNHRRTVDNLRATLLFSNAMPQVPELNRGSWRMLEAQVQALARDPRATGVWVCTAPIWMPDGPVTDRATFTVTVLGEHRVAVPTHCGKAVLLETDDGVELSAWILPNRKVTEPLAAYRTSTDAFEQATGLDVWAELPDDQEHVLEARLVKE